MTREQAVKWLTRIEDKYIHGGDDDFDAKRKQAIAMAIEALQTDIVRCGSCIHGQKILKAKEEVACDIWGGIWTENGFCSCGERREE